MNDLSTSPLRIYNTLTRRKEDFKPITPGFVGMYVCGPTVYGEPHLGHARPAVTFDLLFRYLKHLGFKVRYVRNITDVGHLVNDADAGEDKIAKKAAADKLEPMEVVRYYTESYHVAMRALNTLTPSIEPTATGHILEQIEWVEQLLKNGWAYESNGSVYFDVEKFAQSHDYGKLSGRKLEDLLQNTRDLDGQSDKKHPADFAIWKAASPEHIMRWNSPWGEGFPGWHLECSVMSTKYLGEEFDIHGGGMDLQFPHHECEIAQSVGHCGKESVRYWMHNNMITVNGGQKMGKSLGNFITLNELFTGEHKLLVQSYSPMTIRFFMLQAHYRSTVDFSNEALQAAEKGYKRLMNAYALMNKLEHPGHESGDKPEEEKAIFEACDLAYTHMNDDLNTAQVLADLFVLSSKIYALHNKQLSMSSISKAAFDKMGETLHVFINEILGLQEEAVGGDDGVTDGLMELVLELRQSARANKDWGTSDLIRDRLKELSISVKDGKEGSTWSVG